MSGTEAGAGQIAADSSAAPAIVALSVMLVWGGTPLFSKLAALRSTRSWSVCFERWWPGLWPCRSCC